MKKTTSHPNPTPSRVLETVAKLIRLTEKEGVKWSHWQRPTNKEKARRNLAEYLQMGCPKVNDKGELVTNQLPEGHEMARFILGDDYITPEEVATTYGVGYTDEQLENFANTLPDAQTILWRRINGYMLIAGPPTELNLLEVRELDNKLFYTETEGWYAESNQKFAQDDKVVAGEWVSIRKEEVPNSFSKTWRKQLKLITEDEHVPNAPTVSYAVTAYYKVRDIYLLSDKCVRTSSVSADGNHVCVGDHDTGGFCINHYRDHARYGHIGVSSAVSEENRENLIA